MATATILNIFNPPKAATHYGGYSYKFHEVWWKESKNFLNPPFFVSMTTAAQFVQPIPIFLAYLVALDVDVVPIKFHQFLFGYDHFCVFRFFNILAVIRMIIRNGASTICLSNNQDTYRMLLIWQNLC